MDFYYIKLKY